MPGTEFFDAETGAENPPLRPIETPIETRTGSQSPHSGGTSATKLDGVRQLGLGGGVRSQLRTRLGLITGSLQGIFANMACF